MRKAYLTLIIFIGAVTFTGCWDYSGFGDDGYKILSFKDATFGERMIAEYDLDGDGKLSWLEAGKAKTIDYDGVNKVVIDCDNSSGTNTAVSNISEIKHFSGAQVLLFAGNNLSGEIDLSALRKLEKIDFSSNSSSSPGRIKKIILSSSLENQTVEIIKDDSTSIEYAKK